MFINDSKEDEDTNDKDNHSNANPNKRNDASDMVINIRVSRYCFNNTFKEELDENNSRYFYK